MTVYGHALCTAVERCQAGSVWAGSCVGLYITESPKKGMQNVSIYHKDDPLCPSSYIIYLWVTTSPNKDMNILLIFLLHEVGFLILRLIYSKNNSRHKSGWLKTWVSGRKVLFCPTWWVPLWSVELVRVRMLNQKFAPASFKSFYFNNWAYFSATHLSTLQQPQLSDVHIFLNLFASESFE